MGAQAQQDPQPQSQEAPPVVTAPSPPPSSATASWEQSHLKARPHLISCGSPRSAGLRSLTSNGQNAFSKIEAMLQCKSLKVARHDISLRGGSWSLSGDCVAKHRCFFHLG